MDIKKGFYRLLHYRPGRETVTFVIFLFISAALWCVLSLNDEERHDYVIQIGVDHMPTGVTVVTPDGRMPRVAVSVKEKALDYIVRRMLGKYRVDIPFADFDIYDGKRLVLSPSKLSAVIAQEFAHESSILAIAPDSISVPFSNAKPVRVPVRLEVQFMPDDHYTISGINVLPVDSVSAYVSAAADSMPLQAVTTANNIRDLKDTTYFKLPLKIVPGVRFVPDTVVVRVDAEPLLARTVSVPVKTRNVPASSHIVTFPVQATVTCLVPLSRYNLKLDQIEIVADYMSAQGNLLPLSIEVPSEFSNVTVSPSWVEYIETE